MPSYLFWRLLTISPPEPPPQIVMVYMTPPPPSTSDFETWYRTEHLALLSKVPGYRRSLRYKLGPPTPLTRDDPRPPTYLAVHEVEDVVEAFGSEEARAANETQWTRRVVEGCGGLEARGECFLFVVFFALLVGWVGRTRGRGRWCADLLVFAVAFELVHAEGY